VALRIAGGAVHDPANGIDDDVRDVCVADGRVVEDLPAGAPVIDARGMVVMPGGVDAELDDTPILDSGFFVLVGNDEFLMRQIAAGESPRVRDYAAWLLGAAAGYALKIVNPGGVELWTRGVRSTTDLESPIGSARA
jgi:formylmethanofuran dehydrogenase subunit A